MRKNFIKQLANLNNQMIYVGSVVEESLNLVLASLTKQDKKMAKEAIDKALEIDELERDVESLSMKLLLEQQPVASDLRQISTTLKMITDLKRIGNHAEDIALIILNTKTKNFVALELITKMGSAAKSMVSQGIDAYVKKDIDIAKQVIDNDDIIDDYFTKMKTTLIKMIETKQIDGELALDLLMISKYFERIGDHTTNIAEWIIYAVTGVHEGD